MKEETYWVLLAKKLCGEATTREMEQLQELSSANPEWGNIKENMQEFWKSEPLTADCPQSCNDVYLLHINRLKEKAPEFEIPSLVSETPNQFVLAPAKKPFYTRWTYYAVAVSFIAAIFFVYTLVEKSSSHSLISSETVLAKPISEVNEISISQGSRSKIQLPDGSQVWINSGSKLTYGNSFNGDSREVQLDGEAYFDVVKDAKHPFIVHTSGIDIKVLGTAFNVKAYNSEPVIEATLIHGSIEVTKKNQQDASRIMLKPHEKLVYNRFSDTDIKDQRAYIKPVLNASSVIIKPLKKNIADSAIVETAWVYNKLIFEDEKFVDVALKMERWYDLKISIENEKVKNYRINGSFVNETAEEALQGLQLMMPFNYSFKNNEIKISKK
jgi:ferric-dicitrate binding protein FerR (iron transport regulator)